MPPARHALILREHCFRRHAFIIFSCCFAFYADFMLPLTLICAYARLPCHLGAPLPFDDAMRTCALCRTDTLRARAKDT